MQNGGAAAFSPTRQNAKGLQIRCTALGLRSAGQDDYVAKCDGKDVGRMYRTIRRRRGAAVDDLRKPALADDQRRSKTPSES